MVVDVQTSPTFQAGMPHLLFQADKDWVMWAGASDDQRFLVGVFVRDSPAATITIMLNWTQALKH